LVRRCTAGAILDYLEQMLRRDKHAAAAADALQAEFWRDWLIQERAELARELSVRRSHLEHLDAVEIHALSHVRSALRALENDIKAIDRMIDSLARRFPDAKSTFPRA
jgi:hypothetical protein